MKVLKLSRVECKDIAGASSIRLLTSQLLLSWKKPFVFHLHHNYHWDTLNDKLYWSPLKTEVNINTSKCYYNYKESLSCCGDFYPFAHTARTNVPCPLLQSGTTASLELSHYHPCPYAQDCCITFLIAHTLCSKHFWNSHKHHVNDHTFEIHTKHGAEIHTNTTPVY